MLNGRIRKEGGGRKKVVDLQPALLQEIEQIVNPHTMGDPMNPLIWTSKSAAKINDYDKNKKYMRERYSCSELSTWRTNKGIDNRCRIRGESKDICDWIQRQGKEDNVFHEYKQNNVEKQILVYPAATDAKDA